MDSELDLVKLVRDLRQIKIVLTSQGILNLDSKLKALSSDKNVLYLNQSDKSDTDDDLEKVKMKAKEVYQSFKL